MADTNIDWATKVWNFVTGCDRVSPGCDNCYALTMAKRLKGMGQPKYQTDGNPATSGPGFGLALHPELVTLPLSWRKPERVFVNSMSDLFHDRVPDDLIAHAWAVMAACPQHTFQILTKRHARMRTLLNDPTFRDNMHDHLWSRQPDAYAPQWPLRNVWTGVSIENQKWADIRIPALLDTPTMRWLSIEPLLGPVDLTPWLTPVDWPACWDTHPPSSECGKCIRPDWVVVGGESGGQARLARLDWIRSIVKQCQTAQVPVYVKQLGTVWATDTITANGRSVRACGDSKGSHPQWWPRDLQVRQYPASMAAT